MTDNILKRFAIAFAFVVSSFAGIAAAADAASPVWRLKFSPDGEHLAAAIGTRAGGHFAIYNVADGSLAKSIFAPEGGLDLDYSPNERWLALATRNPHVIVVGAESTMVRSEWDAAGSVMSVAFSPDGKIVATGSAAAAAIELRETDSGKLLRSFAGHEERVNYVAFSPDGTKLVSGGADGFARLWSVDNGEKLHEHGPYRSHVRRVAFSRDGRYYLTASWDRLSRVFDSTSGELLAVIPSGGNCVDLHPGNRLMVAAGSNTKPSIYNVFVDEPSSEQTRRIGELIAAFKNDDYAIREAAAAELTKIGMAAAPLLKKAMESDDAEVRIRARYVRAAVGSPQPIAELPGHGGEIEAVAFSPDGKLLATGCRGGIIKLWDTSDWKEIRTLALPTQEE